jgi:hypothetical protein
MVDSVPRKHRVRAFEYADGYAEYHAGYEHRFHRREVFEKSQPQFRLKTLMLQIFELFFRNFTHFFFSSVVLFYAVGFIRAERGKPPPSADGTSKG